MSSGTLITLAPTGAESAKADVPALPVTVDEVVATARDCRALGADVLHLHVRGTDTRPTLDLPRVREVVAAVREATDLVVQLSTGGAVTDCLTRASAMTPSSWWRTAVPSRPTSRAPAVTGVPGAGSVSLIPSRCSSTSRRGGRPRLCTRATVSWPR